MPWDGNERRRSDGSMITMLARIEERLIAHTNKVEKHITEDEKQFGDISRDIGWLQKVVYMGLGGLVLVQVLLRIKL